MVGELDRGSLLVSRPEQSWIICTFSSFLEARRELRSLGEQVIRKVETGACWEEQDLGPERLLSWSKCGHVCTQNRMELRFLHEMLSVECGLAGLAEALRVSHRGDPPSPLLRAFTRHPKRWGYQRNPGWPPLGCSVMEGTQPSLQRPPPSLCLQRPRDAGKATRRALWTLGNLPPWGEARAHDRPYVPSGQAQETCEGRAQGRSWSVPPLASHNFREAAPLIHGTVMASKF